MQEEVKTVGLDELDRMLRRIVADRAAVIIKKIEEKKPAAGSRVIDLDADWLIRILLENGAREEDIVRFLRKGLKLEDGRIQAIMHRALSERGDTDPILKLRSGDTGGTDISGLPHDALKKLGDEYE